MRILPTRDSGHLQLTMDSFDLLVINGLVVTASDIANYDIAVKDGKIVLLAPPGVLSKDRAGQVIDAEGGFVMVNTPPCKTDVLLKLEVARWHRLSCTP